MKKILLLSIITLLFTNVLSAQTWVDKMYDPNSNFYDVQKTFNKTFKKKEREMVNEGYEKFKKQKRNRTGKQVKEEEQEEGELPGWEQYKRWEYFMKSRLYPSGNRAVLINAWQDYLDNFAQQNNSNSNSPYNNIQPPSDDRSSTLANWNFVGPFTVPSSGGGAGRVNFIRFAPNNNNIIYVGAPCGGFWRSTDGGTTWATTTDQLPLIGCSDLAINPTNPSILYLAMGDADGAGSPNNSAYTTGIYKSTNGGTTWTQSQNVAVTNFRLISRLLINPQNPNVILQATSVGVYRTRNGGNTWATSPLSGTAGLSFTDIEYCPTDTTIVYAAAKTGLYKSINGGTSFTPVATGLPVAASITRLSVAVTTDAPSNVYVLVSSPTFAYGGLYVSTDFGVTFTLRSSTPNVLGYNNNGLDAGGQGFYDLTLAVSPANQNEVLVGGINIWRSTNGGTSWSIVTHWTGSGAPYIHADQHALEYLPGTSTTFFAGNDGGIYKTTNSGASWTDLSNGLQIGQIYRLGVSVSNSSIISSGWQDNGTNRFNNPNWTRTLGGDGMETAIDPIDPNTQYGEIYYGQISKTTSGGNLNTTLTSSGGAGVNANGDWVTPFILNPLKPSTLLIGKAQVYKSINKGTTWVQVGSVSAAGNIIALAYAPSDSNTIYAASQTKFFTSTNGTSFTDRTLGLPVANAAITYIAVANNNPLKLWVTFSGFSAVNKVFTSNDGGVTWVNYTDTGLPNLPVNTIVYNNNSTNDGLYIGTDVGVYYRNNTLTTWQTYNSGMPNVSVGELEIHYGTMQLYAATFGRGIWQSDISETTNASVAIVTGTTTICSGVVATFTANPTNGGSTPTYQWQVNGINISGATSSTFTTSTLTSGQSVNCVMTSSMVGATNNPATSNPIILTVNINATAGINISASSTTICSGSSVIFNATPSNGGAAPFYQWKIDGVNAGSNSTAFTTAGLVNGNVVTCLMTSNASCVSGSPATSNSISIVVTPNITASVITSSSATTICAGTTVTFTATPTNGGIPSYQWKVNGSNVGTNSSTFSSSSLVNNDVVTCIMTTSLACALNNPSTSNAVTITVNPNVTVNVSITASAATICSGASITFSAIPINGGVSPSYQWKLNGSNVSGATGATFTPIAPIIAIDAVSCVMTSNAACMTGSPATSNSITTTVFSSTTASANITASSTTICPNTSVSFTVNPSNGGTTPFYQWKVNGNNVGTNSINFSSSVLANNDVVTCVLTSNAVCVSNNPTNSNTINMAVTSAGTASVAIAASTTSICSGTTVTYTATPTNGGSSPSYQWKINGANIGSNSAIFSSSTLANNDVVTCVMTSNATCVSGSPTTSNSITTTVNISTSASISILASSSTVCSGAAVNFTASATSGGSSPSYQWKVNGVNAGSNSSSFSSSTLSNNDIVSCVMTSNLACVSNSPATSNTITMTINSSASASVTITSLTNTICSGTSLSFSATPTNGGTSPSYQWKVNGSNFGTNSTTFISSTLTNANTVTCVMNSNAACASGSPSTSNSIFITVNPSVSASLNIVSSTTTICSGTNVSFTSTPTNGGISPTYQWKINGTNVGTNTAIFSSTTLTNNNTVSCVLTSNGACVSNSTVSSNFVTITVNNSVTPSINVFSSVTTICSGSSVLLTATSVNGGASPGYQWKLNGVNAGTNSSTLTSSTFNNNDVVSCVLSSNALCLSTSTVTSNSVTMTVNPNSIAGINIISGTNTICSGTSLTFTATPSNGGPAPSYVWFVNGIHTGTNSPIFTSSSFTNGNTVSCELNSNGTCVNGSPATSNTVTLTVNPVVTATVNIVANATTICSGTNVSFTATPTNGGNSPTYQWQLNGANIGTNSSLFSSASFANNDVIACFMTSNVSCVNIPSVNSNIVRMTVNPNLTASVNIIASATNICSGTPTSFTATPTNGGVAPVYQWKVNGSNAGTNSIIFTTSSLVNNDVVTCVLTSNAACISSNPATSNLITMTGNASVTASVSITTNSTTICSGSVATFTATPVNGGGSPTYQWKVNGTNVGTNNSIFSSSTLTNGNIITCVLTSNASCTTGSPATSNSISLTVNSNTTSGVSITSSAISVCSGTSVTFTATPTNGGASPNYQWKVNGVNTGTNSTLFTTSILIGNDVVSCAMTSNTACSLGNPATSNLITMDIHPNLTASVNILSSATNICSGSTVTFTATPTNGGTTTTYQWKKNGSNVGTNSANFSSPALLNNDLITCVMTSNAACVSSNPATSNVILMIQNASVTPSITITASASTICSGTMVTFTAIPTNGGTSPSYQWKKNGNNIGVNSNIYTSSTFADNDVITCVMISNAPCLSTNTVTSNSVTMSVDINAIESVSIAASSNTICTGNSVTFTATPTNGGAAPTYQWQLNGVNTATGLTYSSSLFVDTDSITCIMTSHDACASSNPESNLIVMDVFNSVTAGVAITASASTICSGTSVTFNAIPNSGGSSPSYQWKLNGGNVGTNSPTYSSSTLVSGNVITCVMTSNESCVTGSPATSNAVVMTVNASGVASLTISSSATTICSGTSTVFTAIPTNGGASPSFQWKINGGNAGTNSSTFTSTTLVNSDVVSCVMTSADACLTGSPATSNSISMTVNPNLPVSISVTVSSNTICSGTAATFTASLVNGGTSPSYQWKVNNLNVGTNSALFTSSSLANNATVKCVVTSNAVCALNSPATSNIVTMVVNPSVTASIGITASATTICSGSSVTFTATPNNGGNSPSYQWKVNGTNAGTNSSTFTSTTLNNANVVNCVMTSNATCVSGSTTTSNSFTMTVNSSGTASVSISSSLTTICSGTSVSFTATPINGGTLPSYQWLINGANAGTNNSSFSTNTLLNSDAVSCTMTSNLSCVNNGTTTSNSIAVIVNANISSSVSIVSSATTICSGTAVSFTATPINGGFPSYQWKVNGTNAGTNNAVFTSSILLDNDVVNLSMTSGLSCVSTNPVVSNNITMDVNANVTASVSINASTTNICLGSSVTFTATPINGGTSPSYQWKINGGNVGTNSASFTSSSLVNNDVVTCQMISNAACISGNPAISNSISITENGNVTASIIIAASTTIICSGTSASFTATPTNGGVSPTYHWKVNGSNAGTNSSVFSSASLQNNDIVTCALVSNAVCISNSNATSNSISIVVNPTGTASVSIVSSTTSICSGTAVSYTATPVNGGTPVYQWKVNGINIGTSNTVFTSSILNDNDAVSVSMTSSSGCVIINPVISNTLTIDVNPNVTASVAVSVNASNICSGTTTTFTATPTNGGTTPIYQWKLNGSNVGTNSVNYSSNALINNDVVTCEMVSNSVCISGSPATSNSIVMTQNATGTASLSISSSITSICSGTSVSFTATPTNGGSSPHYQWKVNGTNIGTNSSLFISSLFQNNDVVTCDLVSNAPCVSSVPVVSNSITISVTSSASASVSIISSTTSICSGTIVSFTATPLNGGTPSYQWKVNGVNAGTDNAVFSSSTLFDNDAITVSLTSSLGCVSINPVVSNTIVIDVNPNVTANVNITVNASNICSGTTATFTATPTNGGATPIYQWKLNGNNVGVNSVNYSSNTLINNDVITCEITSNAVCMSGSPATSNSIVMTQNVTGTASVSIAASSTTICSGTAVTFTATATNGGNAPHFQWKVNGTNTGINSFNFSSSSLLNNDLVTCELVSNAPCVNSTPALSNAISVSVSSSASASVSVVSSTTSICSGTVVSFTATPLNGGTPSYQWKVNGVNAGTNNAVFTSSTFNDNDAITVVMTGSASCAGNNSVTSNSISIDVNQNITASVFILANATNICSGNAITFTATPTNGGNTAVYQWKLNGSNVGTNSDVYLSTGLLNGDVVRCVMTSNAPCVSGSPATSNNLTMTENPTDTVRVSIVANTPNGFCVGTPAVFTATPVFGGTLPTYHWKVNGLNAGINSATFTTSTLTNNDVVSCVLTSNAVCVVNTTATSNSITVTASQPSAEPISANASSFVVCAGNPVTLSIAGGGGGTNEIINWYADNCDDIYIGSGNNLVIFPTFTRDYFVRYEDPSPCNIITNCVMLTVNVSNPSFAPTALSASDLALCTGTSTALSQIGGTLGTGAIWRWYSNPTFTNLVGTSTFSDAYLVVTPTSTTTYYLRAEGTASPCSATVAASQGITITTSNLAPPRPNFITGPQNLCPFVLSGGIATFTANPVSAATSYLWTLLPGMTVVGSAFGNVISVTIDSATFVNGVIKVRSVNGCGISAVTQSLSLVLYPAIPGTIYGPTFICNSGVSSQIVTYSVTPVVSAVSYLWTVPSTVNITGGNGTNVITVSVPPFTNVAGNVAVRTQNSCGNALPKILAINSSPGTLGNISGSTNICTNIITSALATYTVPPIANIFVYTWGVSNGANIITGQGTTRIQVSFTSNFPLQGQISVTASNNCTSTNPKYLTVYKTPTIPGAIFGPIDVCGGSENYSIAAITGATSYSWLMPAGIVINSGQGTTAISVTVINSFTSGTIRVNASNGCGASASRILNVSCVTPSFPFNRDDNQQKKVSSLYPNPTKGKITLELNTPEQETLLQVLDVLGNSVVTKVIVNSTSVVIDLSDTPSGIYLLMLKDKEGNPVYTRRIVRE